MKIEMISLLMEYDRNILNRMNETMKKVGLNPDVTLINVSSLESFEKALTGLDKNKIHKKHY